MSGEEWISLLFSTLLRFITLQTNSFVFHEFIGADVADHIKIIVR